MERARSSAKRAERRWGLVVSDCLGALARASGERNGPGGLAGPVLLLGWNPGAGPFLILSPFSFSVSIFWIDFQMNSSFI